MPEILSRESWTKKARAEIKTRDKGPYSHRVILYGPTDGSGCRPPGETIVRVTRWRSTQRKAIAEAVLYCDARHVKITEFPSGHGY